MKNSKLKTHILKQIFFNKLKVFILIKYFNLMGYSFKIASSQQELDEVYKFRWKIYSEIGFINEDSYPDKRFYDNYESASTNFYVLHKNQIIGSVRLTFNSKKGLPTLNNFNVDLPSNIKSLDDVVEIGRFIVEKKVAKKNRIVSFGLSIMFYNYLLKCKKYNLIIHTTDKLKNAFEKFGIFFNILEEKALTQSHIESRSIIAGYFEKHNLKPMIANILDIVGPDDYANVYDK